MSCGGGGFTPDGAYDSVWDSVRPMTGKFFINYFQYQEVVGCVGMLNSWFSSNDDICPDNYNYSGAEGKLHVQFLPVPRGRWVRLHAHCRFSSIDDFCTDNHNCFQLKLKGKGRSGAASQVVDVPVVQLHRCCPWIDGLSFRPCTQVHGQGLPLPSGRRRSGGDAGSLLSGVLPHN